MEGTGVIDRFLEVFTRYIDTGFGLIHGEVAFVATTLIVIDVTLAALFWVWGEGDEILTRLVRKTLFIGCFAWIIGNWSMLARIVFESFAGLGLKASGTAMSTAELLQPGHIAQTGLDAARPLLDAIAGLMGYVSFFENFIQIVVLLFAWAIVLLSFFVLAIQLFITLIEFKLATLCGFVLIPFGLFGKTAFMAERVLGHVVSSGIKILVLAVIVGIGSTLFGEFTASLGSAQPTIEDAMTIVLAALSLLGLGIFGPGIANGIVSGGPQLGAGAAAGTALAAGGLAAGAAATASLATGAAASAAGAVTKGLGKAGGAAAGGTPPNGPTPPAGGSPAAGAPAAGPAGETSPLRPADDGAVRDATPGPESAEGDQSRAGEGDNPSTTPTWARDLRRRQAISHGATIAAQTLRAGDGGGSGASADLSEKD
jgi:type IV secretion system protein TrbL